MSINTAYFKALVSGEPIEARLPYGEPFTLDRYAKLLFNCNELPKDVEHTNAYFRRFLIIPFDVTIPEEKQDKELSSKIIESELSGVFNWVLAGLDRLLTQKKFTYCEAVENARKMYETESDSVKMFLEEMDYIKSSESYTLMKELYREYKNFCLDSGYRPFNKQNFKKHLETIGVLTERKNLGNVAFLTQVSNGF